MEAFKIRQRYSLGFPKDQYLDTCTKLTSIMNKFADDTKLGHKVNTDRDRE